MTLYRGADAAYSGALLPAGTQILAAYVGEVTDPGAPDTPHVWSADEWNFYVGLQPDLRLLPIYVHNYSGNAVADADNAANAVLELGWTPHIGRLVAFDLETFVDPPYVSAVLAQLDVRGFTGIPYGSAFYVDQNPAPHGRWEALLTRNPPTMLPAGAVGQQWRWGLTWDDDVFSQFVYDNCGHGLRH